MTRDRGKLQAWYRQAMLGRIAELRDLRIRVRDAQPAACDEVRKIGQALRGSGATFGFPRLTAAAGLVETSTDGALLRRLEGLLTILGDLTREEREGRALSAEWIAHAVGREADDEPFASEVAAAWEEACRRTGLERSDVASRLAEYLGLEVADPGARARAALRLVPEALVTSRRVVPLDEDSATITLATSDPTDLETELEVQRLTGRTPVFAVAPPQVVDALVDELYGEQGRRAETDGPIAANAPHRPPEPTEPLEPNEPNEPLEPNEPNELEEARGAGAPEATLPKLQDGDDDPSAPASVPAAGASEPDAPGSGRTDVPTVGGAEIDTAPAKGPTRPPLAGDPGDPGANSARVLVVDDDASARVLVRAVLEKKGWEVVEAEDGLDALEVMRSDDSIGLVVADLNMPRMDGLELIWELRDVRDWERLPIIVVTGEEDEILETQLLEEGADDYVRKPIDPRLFLARVESTLRRTAV